MIKTIRLRYYVQVCILSFKQFFFMKKNMITSDLETPQPYIHRLYKVLYIVRLLVASLQWLILHACLEREHRSCLGGRSGRRARNFKWHWKNQVISIGHKIGPNKRPRRFKRVVARVLNVQTIWLSIQMKHQTSILT